MQDQFLANQCMSSEIADFAGPTSDQSDWVILEIAALAGPKNERDGDSWFCIRRWLLLQEQNLTVWTLLVLN